MDHQGLKTLQQCVVQFPGDARTFIDTRFHARVKSLRDLMKAEPMQRPEQSQEGDHARRPEPGGLIERGRNREIRNRARLIPDAIAVARDYSKSIRSGSQVGVRCLAPRTRILPVFIHAIQLESKANSLWNRHTGRGESDPEA